MLMPAQVNGFLNSHYQTLIKNSTTHPQQVWYDDSLRILVFVVWLAPWNKFYLLTVLHNYDYISLSSCYIHICNFLWSSWHPVAVLCGALSLTCAMSWAGTNAPTPHPETTRRNQNLKVQAEGIVPPDTVTTKHI